VCRGEEIDIKDSRIKDQNLILNISFPKAGGQFISPVAINVVLGQKSIELEQKEVESIVKAYRSNRGTSISQSGFIVGSISFDDKESDNDCDRSMYKSDASLPDIEGLIALFNGINETPPEDPPKDPDPEKPPVSVLKKDKRCKIALSFPDNHVVDGVAKYNTNHKMYFNIRVTGCPVDEVKFRDAKLYLGDYLISDIQKLGGEDYFGTSIKVHNGKLDLIYTISAPVHSAALNYLKNKVSASNPVLKTEAILETNQCVSEGNCEGDSIYYEQEKALVAIDFSSTFPKKQLGSGGDSENKDINTNSKQSGSGGDSENKDINTNPGGSQSKLPEENAPGASFNCIPLIMFQKNPLSLASNSFDDFLYANHDVIEVRLIEKGGENPCKAYGIKDLKIYFDSNLNDFLNEDIVLYERYNYWIVGDKNINKLYILVKDKLGKSKDVINYFKKNNK